MKTRIICLIILAILSILLFTGCTEVHQVSYNIGQEADNFNVTRRIVVYNARTDKLVFELIGNFSILNNTNNELEVVCEVENNIFKKHFVYLNEYTMALIAIVQEYY